MVIKNGYQQKTGIILMSIVNKHILTQIEMLCVNQKNKNNRKACFFNQLCVMCDKTCFNIYSNS